MNLDNTFISRLLKEPSPSILKDLGVTPEMLFDDARNALYVINDFYAKYGKMPDQDTLAQAVGMKFEDVCPEPLLFYVDLVKTRAVTNVLGSSVNNASNFLSRAQHEKAIEVLKVGLQEAGKIKETSKDSGLFDLRQGTDERWKDYQRVKSLQGKIDGMALPWPTLNEHTMGVHKGELWFIVARMKTGKCLKKGTLIPDSKTGVLVPIENARNVFTFSNGSICAAVPSNFWNNGEKDCLRLKTRLGYVLEATYNEPMLTPSGWVNLENLKCGDNIAAAARIPEPIFTDDVLVEEVILAAAFLSGFIWNDRGIKCFGLHPDLSTEIKNALQVMGESRVFELLRSWKKDEIPSFVFSLPNFILLKFIGFLWSCGGVITPNNLFFSHASEKVIDGLQHLLLRFSVVAKKKGHLFKDLQGNECDGWCLSVLRSSFRNFKNFIGMEIKGKKLKFLDNIKGGDDWSLKETKEIWQEIEKALQAANKTLKQFREDCYGVNDLTNGNGYFSRNALRRLVFWLGAENLKNLVSEDIIWDEVDFIEPIGSFETYDLTVPESHCFVAGGLIVHNTWIEIALSTNFWSLGYKPLLISMEMPISKIVRRIDAMLARLPYGGFRTGKLSTEQEIQYAAMLEIFKNESKIPFWVAGNGRVRTPSDVELMIEELKPDVVLIDGVYLMQSENQSNSKWERVSSVVDNLQSLCQRKMIPIIATTQFNRRVKRGKMDAGSEDLGFAYEIGQTADVLLGMFQDDDMRAAKRMLLKLMEHREGEPVSITVTWDLDTMVFTEVGVEHGGDIIKKDDIDDDTIPY